MICPEHYRLCITVHIRDGGSALLLLYIVPETVAAAGILRPNKHVYDIIILYTILL